MLNGERLVELTPKDRKYRPLCVIVLGGEEALAYLITVV